MMSYIESTEFKGVTGDIKFHGSNRPGAINILQFFLNGTRVIGKFDPTIPSKDGGLEVKQDKIKWLTRGGTAPTDGEKGLTSI